VKARGCAAAVNRIKMTKGKSQIEKMENEREIVTGDWGLGIQVIRD
jgi:hypothetical protein